MNPVNLFKDAYAAAMDSERDFSERTFLILSLVSEVTVFLALLGDIYIRENPYEIGLILVILIAVPLIALVGLRLEKLKLCIKITVIFLVFIVLPGLFFFGGGIKGGGVLWIIYGYLYVGLVLNGKWRNVMFLFITVFSLLGYIINYYYPWWVYRHSTSKHYIDSFISLVLVGILCFVVNWCQRRLFMKENERAKKEAERAEELTQSQNRFFSSMSHEIRTPINSILGLNELILRDQEASDEIIRDANGIQGAGKMLLALINDILDFSKIEAESMDIVPVDYHVGDLLSEIVNMMWLRAHDKGIGFEASIDPDVPSVLYGDEVRIKQVIVNLLNNAIKYTKEGHVELRIESNVGEDTTELIISIADTGMGIKKEDIPYLFDAFKRVDEGKNRHIEGTGLGLSIVKQLVELMDGTISVNSIYGEGSTFTVTVRQGISDRSKIGELNIQNQQVIKRSTYESSFLAPEVRILIVDDNEMNLEVEKRLLIDTDMGIDTVKSGKEALELCNKSHYDAIFMDHLMPEMDGIECLEAIRNQEGGLNRNTPVIILTANAGSENRELYSRSGFDGYLVKPVSGEAMEEILIRHLSNEKIILRSVMMGEGEEIHTADRYSEKSPVVITSSSMCDLPDHVIKRYEIPIIPFRVSTEQGIFLDGTHIDASELTRYMASGGKAVSSPPDENEYTEFFSNVLKRAHHIIHISITVAMSREYMIASEAAKSFDNVSVINSECLSSSTGILVLIAYKLVQQGLQVDDIISELETFKKRIKCGFIIRDTEYMMRKGLVSTGLHKIANALNLHPAIKFKDDKAKLGGIWMGRTRRAYKKYIASAIPTDTIPDSDVVFITYVDVDSDILKWIEEEIKKTAYFKHVIFQQASAAISSNCGSGTFGILYFLKSNKKYNIYTLIDNAFDEGASTERDQASGREETSGDAEDTVEEENFGEEEGFGDEESPGEEDNFTDEDIFTDEDSREDEKAGIAIEGIDVETAIKNSGSEDAFKAVLKIFYDSIVEKHKEIEGFFESGDWENYTIKVHALKSSSRLVGATGLSIKAEELENAGKRNDISFIKDHHRAAMDDFISYREALKPVFFEEEEIKDQTGDDERPEADQYMMEDFFAAFMDAAESEDADMLKAIMDELGEFSIPDTYSEKFGLIREKAEANDFAGIKEVLER